MQYSAAHLSTLRNNSLDESHKIQVLLYVKGDYLMAKRSIGEGIQLDITQDHIDKCIDRHKQCLVRRIKDEHEPPADGGIIAILNTIHALSSMIIAKDDKAGRGLDTGDELQ